MFIEERLPDNISKGVTGGLTFATIITTTGSGSEQRVGMWTNGRRKYTISHSQRTREEAVELIAFWTATMGRLKGFRFRDWSDFEGTDELLVEVAHPVWQISKTYTSGSLTYVRPIKKPVINTISIKSGGSTLPPAAYSVDTTTGLVTFNQSVVTPIATFQFDVPVRFDTDEMGMEQTDIDEFHWNSIPLIEVLL